MDQNQNTVRATSIRLSTVATSTRQTPKTDFGTIMRDGLIKAGSVVADGLKVAAPYVPGGAILSAALAGANASHGMIGVTGSSGGGYSGSYGTQGGAYGSTSSALTSTGAASTAGNYSDGTLAIPGRRPGLDTDLSTSSSSFATSGTVAEPSDAFNQMMTATKQMSEFQASFNLQYLQLQEKIQIDARQFNLISNIMKAKHDAAKNALNNVR